MSAVSRMARNGSFRTSSLLHNGTSTYRAATFVFQMHRAASGSIPLSRALLVSQARRGYVTETSTSSGGGTAFPPPGFNTEQAKKPPPKQSKGEETSKLEKEADEIATEVETIKADVRSNTMSTAPTGVAKTKAMADQSLAELAAMKATAKTPAEEGQIAKAEKEQKKLTIWQKVKKEVRHYWDGTKLLGTEIKISSKLALKMAAGYELSRRENRQLQRTVQDLARLVPFSVFVIVPFAELLLPVALKLFPNLLPSTYEGQASRDKKLTSLRTTRKEVSSFLRNTLKETGLPVSKANAQKEEFTEFFRKVRATGESPTQSDVIKVCKIFKDDLTLDNLSRPQLVGMCRYMNLNAFGADAMLRYHIRHRMRQIKRDDRAISFEGVDSLSVPELQMACASRGLRTHGVSPARLRDDLQMWLDLRLKHGIPSTLLVLSNAYMYTSTQGKESEMGSQIDALQAVLSSIPEELFHEIELEVHNAEGAATNKQRLEVLKEQEELIQEENKQSEETSESGQKQPKDHENIDEERKAESNSSQESEAKEAESEAEDIKQQEEAAKSK